MPSLRDAPSSLTSSCLYQLTWKKWQGVVAEQSEDEACLTNGQSQIYKKLNYADYHHEIIDPNHFLRILVWIRDSRSDWNFPYHLILNKLPSKTNAASLFQRKILKIFFRFWKSPTFLAETNSKRHALKVRYCQDTCNPSLWVYNLKGLSTA